MLIINVVFFIVQPILFYFGYKYRGKKGTKAVYYEHNNKLELFWTMVPALALAVLIIWGLNVWSGLMMPENEEEPIVIELYAQQFNWIARCFASSMNLSPLSKPMPFLRFMQVRHAVCSWHHCQLTL